jgi:phosphatidylinositol 4-kinase
VHGLKRFATEVGESLSQLSPAQDSSAHGQSKSKSIHEMPTEDDDDSDSDEEREEPDSSRRRQQQQQQQEKQDEEAAAGSTQRVPSSRRRPPHRSQSTDSFAQSFTQTSEAAGQWSASSRRRSTATLVSERRQEKTSGDSGDSSSLTSETKESSSSSLQTGGGGDKGEAAEIEYRQRASISNDSLDPAHCFSPASRQLGDQPLVVFKERWRDKERRLRAKSGVGNLPGYRLLPVIVKTNDDLRQEEIAAQLLFLMNQILIEGEVQCWLRPYGIIAMSPDSGLIEAIPDTVSMDVLRRSVPNYSTLRTFFENFFGPEGSTAFTKARDNFVKSLAPYCIVCYLLNLKDRHNGNILLDRKGHVMHIDFGFIFGISPGGNIGFESAPFKLTAEFVELMDGPHSALFHRFRECCVKTFMELRKHHYRIALLLEMISVGNEHLPCFAGDPGRIIDEMRKRFVPHIHDQAAIGHVHVLINQSIDNWTTSCYDKYQKYFVGVF